MRNQTVTKWKRDALETNWNYRGTEDAKAKLIRKLSNQITLLADEVISLKVMTGKDKS